MMNLKKCLTAAGAVLFCSTLALAQEADEKALQYTQQAIMQSMTIFEAHKAQNKLNDTDRKIETALRETLPGIFNRVVNEEDLSTELDEAITSLADTLLTYQDLYPQDMLDRELAKSLTFYVAIMYAAQENLITPEAGEIIQEWLIEMLLDLGLEE